MSGTEKLETAQNKNSDESEAEAAASAAASAQTTSSDETSEASTDSSSELEKQITALQAQLSEVNKESAGRRHKLKEYEDAASAAELEKMGEVERLTTQLVTAQSEAEKVEALTTQVTSYQEAVTAFVEDLQKQLDIPDHIKSLLEEKDALAQLNYLTKNREAFASPNPPPTKPNINSAAKGGKSTQAETDEARKKRLRGRLPSLRR